MTQSRTKFQFFQEASLSQKLAATEEGMIYQKLAGSDRKISDSIGFFLMLDKHELIDIENDPNMSLMMDLLDVQRKSAFATSPHTNEITKMGLQMPKGENIISEFGE